MIAPPPPGLNAVRGTKLRIGGLVSTVLPDIDFETYSEAGFVWDPVAQKFKAPKGATKKGLPAVGMAAYAAHLSTEVLCCAYDLKDGKGRKRWRPGQPLPTDLFAYLLRFDPYAAPSYDQDGIIEAHNSMFELRIILAVCVRRYGWPTLELTQFRCSAAKARAHALPGALGPLSAALDLSTKKNTNGERLIKKFSMPKDPTKKDGRTRILMASEPIDAELFCDYNEDDIKVESEASQLIPDLPPNELRYWLADQAINFRGVQCDVAAVENCMAVLEQALQKYNNELHDLTRGEVARASELQKLKSWLASQSVYVDAMDEDALDEILNRDNLPDVCRRALQIRRLIGSASVKKVYSMARQVTPDNRLCDMAIYHGARTGRDNGDGVQPLNMPKAGPDLKWCITTAKPFDQKLNDCPWCGAVACTAFSHRTSWGAEAVDHVLDVMSARSLELVEYYFGNALLSISGCARGLFIARDGYRLMGADYSSIEAVAAACLAGEQWRIDAFNAKRDIYLESASRITGRSYDWYMANGGKKHPDRQKIGKPAELGLGFGGWLGAWRQFDSSDTFTDGQVADNIMAWRDASPAIVEMWGGQCRGKPWAPDYLELYGLEGAAIRAIQDPGVEYRYRDISYRVECDRLYCTLPSGRLLTYHQPRLTPSQKWEGQVQINFRGWNSNPKKGAMGWVWMSTYGAQLFENVVQGSPRDIMANAVINLEAAGFPVVLRVHDEIITEVPENDERFTMAEQVRIMTTLPEWAKGWPVRAEGWDSPKKRYQKD